MTSNSTQAENIMHSVYNRPLLIVSFAQQGARLYRLQNALYAIARTSVRPSVCHTARIRYLNCKIFASTAAIVFPVGMPRLALVASHAALLRH